MTHRISLRIYVLALLLALLLTSLAVIVIVQYNATRNMLIVSAEQLFARASSNTSQSLNAIGEKAAMAATLVSRSSLADETDLEGREKYAAMLAEILRQDEAISAVYMGYRDGDFFLMRKVTPGQKGADRLAAPPDSHFLLQTIMRDGPSSPLQGRYTFYDASLHILQNRVEPDYSFDPRLRDWYKAAINTVGIHQSMPYVFYTTGELGLTFSRQDPTGSAVAGADVTLAQLNTILEDDRPTTSSVAVILGTGNLVVASSEAGKRSEQALSPTDGYAMPPALANAGKQTLDDILQATDKDNMVSRALMEGQQRWRIFAQTFSGSGSYRLVIASPESELTAEAERIRRNLLYWCIGVIAVSIALALVIAHIIAGSLRRLESKAHEIGLLRFNTRHKNRSFIVEVDRLGMAIDKLETTVQRLLSVSKALTSEEDYTALLDQIMSSTVEATEARGAILYLTGADGRLEPACAMMDGNHLDPDQIPALDRQQRNHPAMTTDGASGRVFAVSEAEISRWYTGTIPAEDFTLMSVGLSDRKDLRLGALLLFLAPSSDPGHDRADILAFTTAISGLASSVIETARLIHDQRKTIFGMVELVASAIDQKSPYTGAHCQRVPVLTEMIAKAAIATKEGPLKDFSMTADEQQSLNLAAWLHDCGKVTTPEYVIDKSTKLETIHNRIHEIRTRFEVAKREAEVHCWRDIAEQGLTGEDRQARLDALEQQWAELDADFTFVASCNTGAESIHPETIARLNAIAAKSWTRTLSDRLGLSWEEEARMARTDAPDLPVAEPLLADSPNHIIERQERDKIDPDNPWGFTINVPTVLYNRGEIYNLSIGRGTLTDEEFYKIKEHAVSTIRMLDKIPFPAHLNGIRYLAGAHHERMDGKGYPCSLDAAELSIPARMIAVADVFEALTAADRPYRRAMPLSRALSIMSSMRAEGHIDGDIFALFLTSGACLSYARANMKPEQVDTVRIEDYL
ncbi:hypothetical protein FJU08_12085 [Martelella alba]|uniref:HD-GYP domain-containing protein n=1 Tax=Martelella alba TaxID=2590451 RepID=A0A506U6P3_9HYPH|nr:HD domain-containing phosphohydrolase [Martelella alba]TPW30062.1 hypothetical protein FJU08_12085 [Martelella alba]